ncbi:MAG: toll/interleukin-1 receptor domain-containing protein [Lysobacterales bacterium]
MNDKSKYKYKAYISYSHRNERWATWLHRALESYRVPRKLVGTLTGRGKVPARIRPVFRDRDDLSSSSDLASTVKQALADSENLIILCSPEAAASVWVNEEIRQFAALGRHQQIFCVIVDGQPSGPGIKATCFPAALAEIGLDEPLAADVRKWADGKRLAKLKLISGMLGLPLDQLARRDLQKRQKVWALALVASVAIATVMISAVNSRIAAQQRRVSGESLVSYKLNELRTMLDNGTNPENLAETGIWNPQEAEKLAATLGDGAGALTRKAIELREQGKELYENGASQEALEKFQQSWLLLAENYRRDRSNQNAFFELGQADFYIGQSYTDLGEMEKAEEAFMLYAEITRRLIVQQPENSEWVLEMAYALTNLGSLEQKNIDGDPQRALQFMQSALEYNQIALVLDPQNEYYRSELGQSHAFLADAQRGVCDLHGALQSRQENVLLEREMLAEDNQDSTKITRLAWALSGLARVQDEMGRVDVAKASIESSIELMERILLRKPDDKRLASYIFSRKQLLAMLQAFNGTYEQSMQTMDALNEKWQRYFQNSVEDDRGADMDYTSFLIDRAWVAKAMNDPGLAVKLLEEGMSRSISALQKLPGDRNAGNLLMLAAFRYWDLKQTLPDESILMNLPYYYSSSGQIRACFDASLAVRKAIMLGDRDRAEELTLYLMGNGYAETTFMRACRAHAFCNGR